MTKQQLENKQIENVVVGFELKEHCSLEIKV